MRIFKRNSGRISSRYVLYTKDLQKDGQTLFLPVFPHSCRRSLFFCYNMISANVLIISDLRKCWGIIPWKMVPEKGIIPWKQALYWGIILCFWCVFWGIIPFSRCQMPVVCYPLWLDRKRRLNACQRWNLSLRFVTSSSVCWFLLSIDIMSLGISVGLPIVGWGLI